MRIIKIISSILIVLSTNSLLANDEINTGIVELTKILNQKLKNKNVQQIDKYSYLSKYKAGDNKLIIITISNKKLYVTDIAKLYGVSYKKMLKILDTTEEKNHRKIAGKKASISICNKGIFKKLLYAGASINYMTYFNDGVLFNSYTISKQDCAKSKSLMPLSKFIEITAPVFPEYFASVFGGMLIIYFLTLPILKILIKPKSILLKRWHILGVISATLFSTFTLLFLAYFYNDFDYLPSPKKNNSGYYLILVGYSVFLHFILRLKYSRIKNEIINKT